MKAIILARVSTEEQKEAGNSLPAQVERIELYCKRNNLEIAERFVFSESAYKTKRDEFDKALAFLDNQKEIIAVVFDKVDRFSRSVFDKRIPILFKLAQEYKIEIHFASDNQIIKGEMNANQKTQFQMSLVFAEYFSSAISDNVKRAYETMRKEGRATGSIPIGYINSRIDLSDPDSKKIVIKDPARYLYIIKMYDLYSTGQYSDDKIADFMYEEGLRSKGGFKVSKSNIRNILTDPFYIGIRRSMRGNYSHSYERIITQEIFDLCQDVRSGKNNNIKSHTKSLTYIFKGLAKCPNCGCTMTPEGIKNNGNIYYVCSNGKNVCSKTNTRVNEKKLLEPILALLDRLSSMPDGLIKVIDKEINKSINYEKDFRDNQISICEDESKKWQKASDKLIDDYYTESLSITKEQYAEKLQTYKDKTLDAQNKLSEYIKADFSYKSQIIQVVDLCKNSKKLFESSTVEDKNSLLKFLLTNCEVKEKKLIYQVNSPFNYILDLERSMMLRG
ncbi:hypothetical protein AUJ22_01320 [Candidatus Nomurabacteria bacterium CG1_02_31_12]|uniref:Recombinase domain-containing protein n=3 Tax=Candidatus Nomuraibacteriota TaxID=1752729 RepID=A0A1J4UX64_9BACT|nr:MAG: hypothetical protein AUJ22_01320 [Candidatus Nomurabacteria bacterium CG1_02_31_12]